MDSRFRGNDKNSGLLGQPQALTQSMYSIQVVFFIYATSTVETLRRNLQIVFSRDITLSRFVTIFSG